MVLDNDSRGWIMAAVSGIACTAGASIICIDLVIRLLPGQKKFKIENSNHFLSIGLSLSFGVMVFSSLYSILPSSRKYLQEGGLTPKQAAFTLIACFLVGAFVISILSRILHRFIPHSVVDCDHEHDGSEAGDEEEGKPDDQTDGCSHPSPKMLTTEEHREHPSLMDRSGHHSHNHRSYGSTTPNPSELLRRPSLHTQISTKVNQLVTGSKEFCDSDGQCFGYSNPCGDNCFRNVQQQNHIKRSSTQHSKLLRRPTSLRKLAASRERQPLLADLDECAVISPLASEAPHSLDGTGHSHLHSHPHSHSHSHASSPRPSKPASIASSSTSHSASSHADHTVHQHHHHVPTNAFLSIGLQTSTAIALHKIPEGFITYATNHANPTLGFSIFLALFIHNITEGFAMALPLYLAIGSRWKAMFWSALLGGVSQPLGAAVAALWFKIAAARGDGKEDAGPGEIVYGAMFAITAGVMTMVGLQLFGEALDLTHSRKLCFVGAFAGMGILGLSSALTA